MSQEDHLIKWKRNAFFRSRDSFRNERIARQLGIEQSEKQSYFISEFLKAQYDVYGISNDICIENIVWESARKMFPGAVIAITGTGLYLAGKSHFSSNSIPGNALALSGTALIVAGCIYSHKAISSCLKAKERAQTILGFLGNKKENYDLMETLALDLYHEFRLPIEMMAKSSKGIDKLILFFIQQIFVAITELPISTLSEYSEKKNKINYLKSHIFGDKKSVPETNLLTEHSDQFNLGWKLDELIMNAPIVHVSGIGAEEDSYRFKVYTNVSDTKIRYNLLQLKNIIPHSVSADDTHKYPLKVIYTLEELKSRKGYSHTEGIILPEQFCIMPNKIGTKFYQPLPTKMVFELIKFYAHLRICRQEPTNGKNFMDTLKGFATLANWVLQKNGSYTDLFSKFLILQNLRNIYWQVLGETIKEKCYFDDASIFLLWQHAHQLFCKLSGFCSNETLAQQKIRDEERVALYLNTNQEVSKSNLTDNFDCNFNYLRKRSIDLLNEREPFENKGEDEYAGNKFNSN